MKISVAMATYNGELFVREQLESIFAQTRPVDEVVICDDCSIDHTVEIIHEFIGAHNLAHWSLHINDKNVGYIKNFYSAIARTTGDIIFLSDQDDIWHLDKIHIMKELFLTHPKLMALNTSFRKVDSSGNPFAQRLSATYNNHGLLPFRMEADECVRIPFEKVLWKNISPGCTMAFRASLKPFLMQHASFYAPHDWEINLFSALEEGLYFYNRELIDYRIHASNTLGMSTGQRGSLRMNADQSTRERRAAEDAQKAEQYILSKWIDSLSSERKRDLTKYRTTTLARNQLLFEKRISKWCATVLTMFSDYRKMQGVRGILGDLIYIIKTR